MSHSDTTKKRISKALTGKKLSGEHKRNIGAGVKASNAVNGIKSGAKKGRKQSLEHILKKAASCKATNKKNGKNPRLLSDREYIVWFDKQNGLCAICGNPETWKNQFGLCKLSRDHDHQTGKVRGLLCNSCNNILRCCKDSIETLTKTIKYLKGESNE